MSTSRIFFISTWNNNHFLQIGFPLKNIFWKKYALKKLQFWTILFSYNMYITEKRTSNSSSVFLSIPLNKLPWCSAIFGSSCSVVVCSWCDTLWIHGGKSFTRKSSSNVDDDDVGHILLRILSPNKFTAMAFYSYDKIIKTWIQISCQNWFAFFLKY